MKRLKSKTSYIIIVIVIYTVQCSTLWISHKYSLPIYFWRISWMIILLCVFCITWLLFKKEIWKALGLIKGKVNCRVIIKSIWIGVIFGFISNALLIILLPHGTPLKGGSQMSYLLSLILIGPIFEELLFRGFMQGMLERCFRVKNKIFYILPVFITTIMFAGSHVFGFSQTMEVTQFIIAISLVSLTGLYAGWLRLQYQSIITAVIFHSCVNIGIILSGIFLLFYGYTQI